MDCTIDDIVNFVTSDNNRLTGSIAVAAVIEDPYINTFSGGTFKSGMGGTMKTLSQERASMATSTVWPNFRPYGTNCGPTANVDRTGSKAYFYSLEEYEGKSQNICVKDGFEAFEGQYISAAASLEEGIKELMSGRKRRALYERGGVKVIARTGLSWPSMSNGDIKSVDTLFPAVLPNSGLEMKLAQYIARKMANNLLLETFGKANQAHYTLVADEEVIQGFRDNLGVNQDIRAIAQGSFKVGFDAIMGYQVEGPYQKIGWAIDQRPLRFNELADGTTHMYPGTSTPIPAGQPALLEPYLHPDGDNGIAERINPTWDAAKYGIAFMYARDTFKREVPESYTGEGMMKFSPQNAIGKLEFFNPKDSCNPFGNIGWLQYQIRDAIVPVNPHGAVAITYVRCVGESGAVACEVPDGSTG